MTTRALDFLRRTPPLHEVRVAVVSGAEEYLRARAIARLIEGFGPDAAKDVVEGPTARDVGRFDLASFFDTLRTPSLFGGEGVVVLGNADAVAKEHHDALVRFLGREELRHRLVIEGEAVVPKAKGRAGPAKDGLAAAVLATGGLVVTCDPLYDTPFAGRGPAWQTELVRWMVDEVRARGKEIASEDAYELQQLVGTSLRELAAEIEKLVTLAGPRRRIEAADVEAAVGAARTSPAFRLAEAIASCNLKESLRVSAELFERGAQDPSAARRVTDDGAITMMLVGATAQKLRRIGTVLDALARGTPLDAALALVPTHPAFRAQLERQVQAWRDRSLGQATLALVELEKDLKSAGGPPRELVDRFLVTALREPAAQGRARRRA